MSDFVLRRLAAEDAEAFREIRLEGLTSHPAAFGSDYDDESAKPVDWFEKRIVESAMFGAFSKHDGALAGVTGIVVPSGAKLKHKGMLVGMYVGPRARGTGLAAALLDYVLAHARTVVEEVKLHVATDNASAIRLYEAAGFRVYAREPRDLKIGGVYYDALLMRVRFDAAG